MDIQIRNIHMNTVHLSEKEKKKKLDGLISVYLSLKSAVFT